MVVGGLAGFMSTCWHFNVLSMLTQCPLGFIGSVFLAAHFPSVLVFDARWGHVWVRNISITEYTHKTEQKKHICSTFIVFNWSVLCSAHKRTRKDFFFCHNVMLLKTLLWLRMHTNNFGVLQCMHIPFNNPVWFQGNPTDLLKHLCYYMSMEFSSCQAL